jgi:LPS-assembly protein
MGLYGKNGGRMTAFLGQSYRLPDDGPLSDTTDIEQGRSDYVGRLEIVPSKYLDLLYRFRAARKDAKLLRSELSIGLGPPAFRFEGEYIFIASEASAGLFPDREEVTASFTSQLTDFWSLGLFSQIDLTQNGGTIKHGAKVTYEDECFRLEFGFRRDFTRTLDIEDQSVFFVDFVFSNLGNVTKSRN